MPKHLDRDLEYLEQDVRRLAQVVDRAITDATLALQERNDSR